MSTRAALCSFTLEEQVQNHKMALDNEALEKTIPIANRFGHYLEVLKDSSLCETNVTDTYDANRFLNGVSEPSTSVADLDANINDDNNVESEKDTNKNLNSKSKRPSIDSKENSICKKHKSSNTSDVTISLEKSKSSSHEHKKSLKLLQKLVC